MHLETDAVDRDSLLPEPLHQLIHAVGLSAATFGAVVVVDQERLGVGPTGEAEGLGEIPGAQLLVERRPAQSVARRLPVVGQRLVDHVPSVDAAAPVADHRPDVVLQRDAQLGSREGVDPVGGRAVPDEGVALDAHAPRLGKRDDPVTAREVEGSGLTLHGKPLHLPLGGDVAEVAAEDGGVVGLAEIARLDRGANQLPRSRGCGGQRLDLGARRTRRRGRGGSRRCGGEVAAAARDELRRGGESQTSNSLRRGQRDPGFSAGSGERRSRPSRACARPRRRSPPRRGPSRPAGSPPSRPPLRSRRRRPRNGKNASEATAVPARSSFAFMIATRAASTRLICPAPTPTVWTGLAKTIALDFTCLATAQARKRAFHSDSVGFRRDTTSQ